jgi:hypothetical protein
MAKEKDKDKVMISLHKPFGPQIMEFVIPENIVNTWNDYGDKITASEKKSKELDMADSLIGNVIQEHKVEEHLWLNKIDKDNKDSGTFKDYVAGMVNIYIKQYLTGIYADEENARKNNISIDQNITQMNVLNSWIVNSIAGDFNPPHMHMGHLSCAGFIRVPDSITNDEEREEAGYLEFMYGESHKFLRFKYSIKPKVGAIYMFPSWLTHFVHPFRGEGIRRSISFNVTYTRGS